MTSKSESGFAFSIRRMVAAGSWALLSLTVFALPAWGTGVILQLPTAHADEIVHLRLNSTQPEADAAVSESPAEIRLFYSEPPQMEGTSIRLADADGELVPTTEAAADADDPKEVFIVPDQPLTPGTYTVHWRTIAQDGHAQRGDFSFQVTGER